ncbi:hypothetical protein C7M84_006710 [Penaeus vannamei]|uniref:Uncharacterized protein n=1 Tax=Penaeus vannamei TaxID=6689 RepID=A0A3R7STT9_PENVA|nr:hypothetical protein C7M84_006710 [Penaeus vannamei]
MHLCKIAFLALLDARALQFISPIATWAEKHQQNISHSDRPYQQVTLLPPRNMPTGHSTSNRRPKSSLCVISRPNVSAADKSDARTRLTLQNIRKVSRDELVCTRRRCIFLSLKTGSGFFPQKTGCGDLSTENGKRFLPTENGMRRPLHRKREAVSSHRKREADYFPQKTRCIFLSQKTGSGLLPQKTGRIFLSQKTRSGFLPQKTERIFLSQKTGSGLISTENEKRISFHRASVPGTYVEVNDERGRREERRRPQHDAVQPVGGGRGRGTRGRRPECGVRAEMKGPGQHGDDGRDDGLDSDSRGDDGRDLGRALVAALMLRRGVLHRDGRCRRLGRRLGRGLAGGLRGRLLLLGRGRGAGAGAAPPVPPGAPLAPPLLRGGGDLARSTTVPRQGPPVVPRWFHSHAAPCPSLPCLALPLGDAGHADPARRSSRRSELRWRGFLLPRGPWPPCDERAAPAQRPGTSPKGAPKKGNRVPRRPSGQRIARLPRRGFRSRLRRRPSGFALPRGRSSPRSLRESRGRTPSTAAFISESGSKLGQLGLQGFSMTTLSSSASPKSTFIHLLCLPVRPRSL